MNICSDHKMERKWIYSLPIEPLPAKPILTAKFECPKCDEILRKALGYEKVKKRGSKRRRKN